MLGKRMQINRLISACLLLGESALANEASTEMIQEPLRAYVVFSPQEIDASHLSRITQWIDEAQSSIDIALYSMQDSSAGVLASLERAKARGVRIRFLFHTANQDRKSPAGTQSSRLEECGIDVRYINKIMHHKFALIDARGGDAVIRPRLITGSANWTSSAASFYDENTLFLTGDRALISRYRSEFDLLWEHSRDFDWVEFSGDFSKEPLTPGLGEEDSFTAADRFAVFTSSNFETIENRYGKGFRTIDDTNTVSRRIVELFKSAKHSIKIATGHLRSFVITNGLIELKRERPELQIQIYLDNQEFISSSYHYFQKAERQRCIDAATSAAALQDCYDSGFYYSYEAVLQGIDLRFKSYAYRWHYSYAPQMHHKYILIDDETLLTGSFNFSDNAEHHTMENVIILQRSQYPEVIDRFAVNFQWMWDRNRSQLVPLQQQILSGQRFPIVFDDMSLSWQELDTLKAMIRDACPSINDAEVREHPEKHRYCEPAETEN